MTSRRLRRAITVGALATLLTAATPAAAFSATAGTERPSTSTEQAGAGTERPSTGTEQAGAGTERVSASATGVQADEPSYEVTISDSGRYAAFTSAAGTLVPGDVNGLPDAFVRDRWRGTVERAAVPPGGAEPDEGASEPALSGTGRYVAFTSFSTNLVPGDTNATGDVFVRDRWTGRTERVSVTSDGAQTDRMSYRPAISDDGRYVAFLSEARNLVGTDANGRFPDVFVRDRRRGVTTLASVSLTGAGGNGYNEGVSISDDGRFVAFLSFSKDLVADGYTQPSVFVRDLRSGTTTRASLSPAGTPVVGVGDARISGDGRYLVFDSEQGDLTPGDTNGTTDIFVRDRWTGRIDRVSVTSDGAEANEFSMLPVISDDGRCVAFQSFASNLVPGDGTGLFDVFVHDRRSGATRRVSVSPTGGDANQYSDGAAISGDGMHVAFTSYASDLVPDDTNGDVDAFVRDGECDRSGT